LSSRFSQIVCLKLYEKPSVSMKRISALLPILLGVVIALNFVHPVFAAEQAADYLNYQEPKVGGSSFLSTIVYVISLLVTFGLVIVAAYFTSRFVGQKMGKAMSFGDNRVLVTLTLGPNRGVSVVEIAGKLLVLGVTDHNINLLQEVTEPEQLDKLRTLQTDTASNQFDAVFQKHLASLQQMSSKFPTAFGGSNRNQPENEREKR
jgi:flagellar protein FliO/FliZ